MTASRVWVLLAALFAAAALYVVREELACGRQFRRYGLIDGRELDR